MFPMGAAACDYKMGEVEMGIAMQQLIRDAHSPGPPTAGQGTSCPSQDGENSETQTMNSIKKELKIVIEKQNNNEVISSIKARIEALEDRKETYAEVQIDNLFKGIQYQRDVIQNKLTEIDA